MEDVLLQSSHSLLRQTSLEKYRLSRFEMRKFIAFDRTGETGTRDIRISRELVHHALPAGNLLKPLRRFDQIPGFVLASGCHHKRKRQTPGGRANKIWNANRIRDVRLKGVGI